MSEETKEREAFEAWYVADAIRRVPDLGLTVEDMRELREGDGYGQRRAMLQGKWEGWLAGRASLAQQAGEDARDAAQLLLLDAARTYANRYALDEAADDGVEITGCTSQQHKDAVALLDAIKFAESVGIGAADSRKGGTDANQA